MVSGTGPKSAAPPPADSSSGHTAMDSHHSGQSQVVTMVAVPRVQIRRVNRTSWLSAPAGRGAKQAQKGLHRIQASTTGSTT